MPECDAVEYAMLHAPASATLHLQSRWWEVADAADAQCLYARAGTHFQKCRLLSLRNEVGGLWLVSNSEAGQFEPSEWLVAARLRFGMPVLP